MNKKVRVHMTLDITASENFLKDLQNHYLRYLLIYYLKYIFVKRIYIFHLF